MATIRERNGTYQISVYAGFDLNGHRKRETLLKICSAKPEHKYSGIKQSRSDSMSYLLCFMVEALKPASHHRK